MKKIIIIAALLFGFMLYAQAPEFDYVMLGKKTTTEKLAIDTSDTTKAYLCFDTTLGQLQINYGLGWLNVGGSGSESTAWGNIPGTLSDQTDLQAALDNKLEESALIDLGNADSPSISNGWLIVKSNANNIVTYEEDLIFEDVPSKNSTILRFSDTFVSQFNSKLNSSQLIDDDTFATATSTNIPSAESVKVYVDANSGGFDPSSDQTITGDWTFENSITDPDSYGLKATQTGYEGKGIMIESSGDEGIGMFIETQGENGRNISLQSYGDNSVGLEVIGSSTKSNIISSGGVDHTGYFYEGYNYSSGTVFSVDKDGNVTGTSFTGDGSGLTNLPSSGSGHTIQENGVDKTDRANLNFKYGFTADDNSGNNSTDIAVDSTVVQVWDPQTQYRYPKWVGLQDDYDTLFPSGHGNREVVILDAEPEPINFTDLDDTPSTYTADKWVKVNSAGNALEFVDAPSGGSSSIDWQGEWVSQNYTVDQAVSYNGSSYICILNTVSNEVPTNTTYWDVLAEKGDTGATGSATGDVQLGFLHFNEFSDKFVIDLDAETITMDGYTCSILKSDGLILETPTTDQVLDFSTFNTNNVMVFIYWDDADNLFHIAATYPSTYVDDADKYFITSFRRYTGQTNINLSFNQHAFRIKANDPEYISKWTILGDSHTQASKWVYECERINGKINEVLRLGYNGSNIADISNFSFYDRRTQITSDTDLLMIYGGTNDYDNNASLGTVQDGGTYTLTTTLGSLQEIIEYAYSLNGEMTIMLMSPMHHFNASTGGSQYTDIANSAGHTMQDYTDGIKSVASYYNIPFLDLNAHIGVNEYNYTNYSADGIHLNDFAGEKAGRIVSEFIKSNY